MRKLVAFTLMILGPGVAALLTAESGWPFQAVAVAVGCLFTWPAAAAVAQIGRVDPTRTIHDASELDRSIMSPRAIAENYWRDQGHPPFMRPRQGLPDHHQFDPDRQN